MIYQGRNLEFLQLQEWKKLADFKQLRSDCLTLVWFTDNATVVMDDQEVAIKANQILCLTNSKYFLAKNLIQARVIQFNRAFYCIRDHDNEVSCSGLLFYTAMQSPLLTIPASEKDKFDTLWKMFGLEMQTTDNLQFEMLQMMLKRLIILCTRLHKQQNRLMSVKTKEPEIIRTYNLMVEQHYKTQHTVTFYAAQLNKSSKTLANLFSKYGLPRPLEVIQGRVMLEARRLLRYTDKSVKEVAYEVGYEDLQAFSRAFRTHEKISPSEFKGKNLLD
jgi:AraC family transcriptional regulator, transcriptional activator of pobA